MAQLEAPSEYCDDSKFGGTISLVIWKIFSGCEVRCLFRLFEIQLAGREWELSSRFDYIHTTYSSTIRSLHKFTVTGLMNFIYSLL